MHILNGVKDQPLSFQQKNFKKKMPFLSISPLKHQLLDINMF